MKRSPLWTILLIAFVDLAGFGLILPLQAVYAERLGISGTMFGLLIGSYAFMQMLFNPILGRWSDRIGRRRVLLISMAGSIASHSLLGVADLAQSVPLLFIARLLDGITGANIATAQAYIADVTKPEERARGMGLFGAAFGLGFVVGPAIGAGLAFAGRHFSGELYGTSWPAFGAAVISFVAFLLVWAYLPESIPKPDVTKSRFRLPAWSNIRKVSADPRMRELLILIFGTIFAFVFLEVTFVYLARDRFGVTEVGTGLLFAYIGIIMVIVQGGLVGKLVKRFGEMSLVATGPFLTAGGFLLISGVPCQAATQTIAWSLLLIGCLFVAGGNSITGPNINALISRKADAYTQGETLGIAQSVGSLARTVAPPIGGFLWDVGPEWPYWIGAALFVALGLFARSVRPAQVAAVQLSHD